MKIARPVDFSHVFVDEASARSFSAAVQNRGLATEMEKSGCDPEMPWDVVVVVEMIPDLDAINRIEQDLSDLAASHGGRDDGWGCVRVIGEGNQV